VRDRRFVLGMALVLMAVPAAMAQTDGTMLHFEVVSVRLNKVPPPRSHALYSSLALAAPFLPDYVLAVFGLSEPSASSIAPASRNSGVSRPSSNQSCKG
jgi:hypothetical protein